MILKKKISKNVHDKYAFVHRTLTNIKITTATATTVALPKHKQNKINLAIIFAPTIPTIITIKSTIKIQ